MTRIYFANLKRALATIVILLSASGSYPLHAIETDLPLSPTPILATAQAHVDQNQVEQNHAETVNNGVYALVANSNDGTVTVFSVATGTAVDTIQVGVDPGPGTDSAPGCVAVTPDNRWALVSYERATAHRLYILAIDKIADGVADNEIVDIIDLGNTNPQEGNCIAITPNGERAYVVGGSNGAGIASIDLTAADDSIDDNEVELIDRGSAYHDSIVITPDGGRAYFSDYTDTIPVLKIDPGNANDNTVIASVVLGDSGTFMKGVAVAPDAKRVYAVDSVFIEKLYVIDSDPASPTYHTLVGELPLTPLNDRPHQVVASPDNRKIYISRDSGVAVVDVNPASADYLTIIQTLKPTTSALWGQGSMALMDDGSILLAVNRYHDSVSIYDTVSGEEVRRVPVGDNPQGIALFQRPQIGPYVSVVDETGAPLADAEVYRNGELMGVSDGNGYVAAEGLTAGDELAALLKIHEERSTRLGHETADGEEGWAFRIYATSLITPTETGGPLPVIADGDDEQVLTVNRSSVLVLFNLVVGIEWDASAGYVAQIASAMESASDYLYDASDGQMALGHVTIIDQREQWREADIQISAGNFVHPYATIKGIFSEDHAAVVRLGRFWDGQTGNAGEWHHPDGFRTIAHELGHYALGIYDEYFKYGVLDPTFCPVPVSTLPDDDAGSASIMSYHYKATEFSALGVTGLWSEACTNTEQWRLNHESPWQTLARIYTAPAEELPAAEQWQFVTPMDRGQALAGPAQMPAVLPAWPIINAGEHEGDLAHSLQLTVYRPGDQPAVNAIVMLQKPSGQMIGQGLTDLHGRLTVLGAEAGDILSVKIARTTLEGQQMVDHETEVVIRLEPGMTAAMTTGHPSIQIIPLEAGASNTSLLVTIENLPATAIPTIAMTPPGDATGFTIVQLSPHEGGFAGTASFAPSSTGTGRIRYKFDEESAGGMTFTNYRLQQIDNGVTSAIFSDDGNLMLQVEPESFVGNHALLAVTAERSLPGPLPADKEIIGEAYSVTATGAAWQLEGDAAARLRLRYDPVLVDDTVTVENLALYRWAFEAEAWEVMESQYDDEHHAFVTTTATLDTYVLLREKDSATDSTMTIHLPVARKD